MRRAVAPAGEPIVCSATFSPVWLHPEGNEKDSATWRHIVQPAWSLDPLAVRFAAIRQWWSFAPARSAAVAGSSRPAGRARRPIFRRGSSWQTDRNVQGGPLQNGTQDFAWGLGVHATNHLWFDLPDAVLAFHTQIGLDRTAGSGGSPRGLIYGNEPSGTPLYQSKHLIGSDESVDTGTLPLGGPAAGQKSLVLVADAAADDHPVGADPLDIRDTVDWLEPLLLLDPAKLKTEVAKRVGRLLPAWDGWDVRVEGDQRPQFQIEWDENNREDRRFVVTAGDRQTAAGDDAAAPLAEGDESLTIVLRFPPRSGRPGQLAVRSDGRTIAQTPVYY